MSELLYLNKTVQLVTNHHSVLLQYRVQGGVQLGYTMGYSVGYRCVCLFA